MDDGSVGTVAGDCLEGFADIEVLPGTIAGQDVGHVKFGQLDAVVQTCFDFHESAYEGHTVFLRGER